MKNKLSIYLSIYLSIVILLLNTNYVHAEHGGSGGSFGSDAFVQYTGYISMEDYSQLPDGMYYFYKYEDGKAWYVPISSAIPLMLNKSVGVSLSEDLMASFKTAYTAYVAGLYSNMSNGVMKNGSAVGLAINDIIGCKLVSPQNQSKDIQIPSSEINNIYNYYNTYITENNLDLPDYINFNTQNVQWAKNHINIQDTTSSAYSDILSTSNLVFWINLNPYDNYYLRNRVYAIPDLNEKILYYQYKDYHSSFEGICNSYNLNQRNNVVLFADMMANNGTGMSVGMYDKTNMADKPYFLTSYQANNDGTYNETLNYQWETYTIGTVTSLPISNTLKSVTVWKDSATMQKVINQTYAPQMFYTKKYYDYDSNVDNSVNTNTQQIDNSSQTNQTIYNEASDSYTEYYSSNNYQIDNSVVIEDNDTIINNYYGDNNSGGDSGGDSGGNGSESDDDSGLIDRLLDALIDFFKMIGKVIAAILTGIVELINQVLDGMANILQAINPFSTLLEALFGFLPDIVVDTISLALTLCIMMAVLKFLRG